MTPMHCIEWRKKRTVVTVVTTQFMFESWFFKLFISLGKKKRKRVIEF